MTYLIIRFSTLGNVAMTVPVVASLSRRYPDDKFIVAGKKELGAMFAQMPNVEFYEVNPRAVLDYLRSMHVPCGLAISPETPAEAILPVIDRIDLALVMTVHPGKSGQAFMPAMMAKVRKIKAASLTRNPELMIQVDGGINPATVGEASAAGANVFVVGSALCDSKRPKSVLTGLKEGIRNHPYKS